MSKTTEDTLEPDGFGVATLDAAFRLEQALAIAMKEIRTRQLMIVSAGVLITAAIAGNTMMAFLK